MIYIYTNGPGDRGSILKKDSQKIALDTSLLNTQHFKVRIRGK